MLQPKDALEGRLINLLREMTAGRPDAVKNICSLLRHDIRPEHHEIQGTIAALLKSPNDDIRIFAAAALGNFGDKGLASVSKLIVAMNEDTNMSVVGAAAASLGAIPCRSSALALINMLEHKALEHIALHVFRALGQLGKEAKSALPALVRLQETTSDTTLQHLANDAWQAIQRKIVEKRSE